MACAFFFVTPKSKALVDTIVRRQREVDGIIHIEPLPPTIDGIIFDGLICWYGRIGLFIRDYVMRKEFILILLGIICISTLSSLLSGFVPKESEKVLLDTVAGKVGAGNFTYWQLGHSGPLLVELTSLKGDADLYVADNISVIERITPRVEATLNIKQINLVHSYTMHQIDLATFRRGYSAMGSMGMPIRPSYEVDRNNFSSVTCGADLVSIPEDFPRPVGIGVFGYWSHQVSEYSIQVFMDTGSVNNEQMQGVVQRAAERSELNKKKESTVPRKAEEEKPRFMKVLNIIDMIFEMFVL